MKFTEAHSGDSAIYLVVVIINHWKQHRLLISLYKSLASFSEPFKDNLKSTESQHKIT